MAISFLRPQSGHKHKDDKIFKRSGGLLLGEIVTVSVHNSANCNGIIR